MGLIYYIIDYIIKKTVTLYTHVYR